MKTQLMVTTLLIAALGVGCAKKSDDSATSDFSTDSLSDTAEASLQSMQGVLDDQSGSSFVLWRSERADKYAILRALIEPAQAANCGRAVSQACASGVRSVAYSSCDVGNTGHFSISGSVALTYSSASCSMSVGDSVVRTYDYSIDGPRGASFKNTSASRTNYLGQSLGGGGRLSRSGTSAWSMDILGKHKIGSFRGQSFYDLSIATSSSVNVTGGLSRSSRILDGGQVDVYHNLAGYTASFVPSQIQFSDSCGCQPVSGSMSVTYTGSITGSASIEFNGCGSATLTKDGVAHSVTLSYCE